MTASRSFPVVAALAASAALCTVLAAPARAQTITFTDIANSNSSEFNTFYRPVVNTSGTVAFVADRDAGGTGVYTATNTSGFTTVALTTSPEFNAFSTIFAPTINDLGLVAFHAGRDVGGAGVYTANNSAGFTTVALTTIGSLLTREMPDTLP